MLNVTSSHFAASSSQERENVFVAQVFASRQSRTCTRVRVGMRTHICTHKHVQKRKADRKLAGGSHAPQLFQVLQVGMKQGAKQSKTYVWRVAAPL